MQHMNHDNKQTKIITFYTCPMHPEIRQDKPGVCPKCGMRLVKKEKQKEHDPYAGHVMSDTSKKINN